MTLCSVTNRRLKRPRLSFLRGYRKQGPELFSRLEAAADAQMKVDSVSCTPHPAARGEVTPSFRGEGVVGNHLKQDDGSQRLAAGVSVQGLITCSCVTCQAPHFKSGRASDSFVLSLSLSSGDSWE